MLRRVLLATVMVAAATTMAIPAANAAPATQQCPTSNGTYIGVKVPLSDLPVTVSVTNTTTAPSSTDVTVTFTDNGTKFTLTSPGSETFTVASWCVKSSTATTTPLYGTETTGATSASNKKDRAQKVGYLMLYSVTTTPQPTGACYDDTSSATTGSFDLLVSEPIGQYGNADYIWSTDGTCTGGSVGFPVTTVISAANATEAADTCAALSNPTGLYREVSSVWDEAPTGLWQCYY